MKFYKCDLFPSHARLHPSDVRGHVFRGPWNKIFRHVTPYFAWFPTFWGKTARAFIFMAETTIFKGCSTLEDKGSTYLLYAVTTHPTIQRQIAEHLNQQHRCEHLKWDRWSVVIEDPDRTRTRWLKSHRRRDRWCNQSSFTKISNIQFCSRVSLGTSYFEILPPLSSNKPDAFCITSCDSPRIQ